MSIKRERSSNWEREEKKLFREIIKPYIQIIENKDLSTITNKAKLKAWNEITDKFNVCNSKIRDKKQMVNQWKLTKLKSKKEMTKHLQENFKIEERQPLSPPLPLELEIHCNEFDCNGVKDRENLSHEENFYMNSKEDEINLINNVINNDKDIKAFDSPCDPPHISSKRTAKKTSKTEFNYAEASYADMHHFRFLENKRLQKEHELRIKHMEEMHAQVLINLKLQEEILNKTLASIKK